MKGKFISVIYAAVVRRRNIAQFLYKSEPQDNLTTLHAFRRKCYII